MCRGTGFKWTAACGDGVAWPNLVLSGKRVVSAQVPESRDGQRNKTGNLEGQLFGHAKIATVSGRWEFLAAGAENGTDDLVSDGGGRGGVSEGRARGLRAVIDQKSVCLAGSNMLRWSPGKRLSVCVGGDSLIRRFRVRERTIWCDKPH